ncbi:IS110 family transposase [Thermosipho globiformans]|uniref:IS110 family transposase n=1 Tax=Thermosipho globiformans TaxID=380685 RepID=UPI001F4A02B3
MINFRGIDLISAFKINNTIDGIKMLEEKIRDAKEEKRLNKVILGMEPSGHYWKPLSLKMKESKEVDYLVRVNTHHVKRVKNYR